MVKLNENEYFIVANSFAAPFCSDTSTGYITGVDENDAMESFKENYNHPAGLYAANLYKDADDYHKNEEPLLMFRQPGKDADEDKSTTTKMRQLMSLAQSHTLCDSGRD